MKNRIKSEYISWILLLGIIVLFLEFSFFNRGLIFSLLVDVGMIYFGRKWKKRSLGKILFWLGIFLLIISIFSMITIKFFLLAILIHFFIQFVQAKKKPDHIKPVIMEPSIKLEKETVIKKKPLFSNHFFGQQKTPDHVYEWNDVNIQTGIGDTIIDLSYTVLPKGETVIFIRNLIGNVQVLVPYDIEISVMHSVIAGSTEVFENQESKIINQTIQVQTPLYDQAEQRIKIFTSIIVGDLEVKRV
ncbi:cell wall-active antibiotics response protein LiaF [Cytobacillus dafuensis]|uniref:Cell wall-active antibiotics response protein n=1 Tax=Cytobacillus dafuensis TaxID=1742359 RepID=A0A5B8Z170_CYTDA|nr:cell wall-active antibiotics response protein LiaF [Cytobacillus dafuensis]QED46720.1 cell wall-active antibiotics response protein [Cytobacillus dafuensis]